MAGFRGFSFLLYMYMYYGNAMVSCFTWPIVDPRFFAQMSGARVNEPLCNESLPPSMRECDTSLCSMILNDTTARMHLINQEPCP